jgi:hypothetical protein
LFLCSDVVGLKARERGDQNLTFFVINLLKILVAAVALNAPKTRREQFGSNRAFGIGAERNFDDGLGAGAEEVPVVIAPGFEPGLVLLPIVRVLKEVIERVGVLIVIMSISISTSVVRVMAKPPIVGCQ